jgi:hypothetical protein
MPNFDTPGGASSPSGGAGAEKSELRVVLSTEGGIKLEDARKELRLVVTSSDEAARALEKSADALSKAADKLVKVADTIGRVGKETTKVTTETAKSLDSVATAAVFKGNLLASAVTSLVRGSGNLLVGFFRLQAQFAGEVANAFSEQTAQIVRQTEAYDRYSISLAAVLRDEERVRLVQRKAFQAGAESPFSIREFEDASQRLVRTPGTRELFFGAEQDVERNSDRLFRLVSRLASTDPRLGVMGAVQAVRTGLQGQFRLLTRQYGISIGELVDVSGKSLKELRSNSEALLGALEIVSERNFPDAYVKQLTQLPSNLASNIRELFTTIIPREIGKAGFQDNVSALLDEFYKVLFDFAKPDGEMARKYAPRISDALSRTVFALVQGAANIVGASIGDDANPFESLFEGIAYVANSLAEYVENIVRLTETPEAKDFFANFFKNATEAVGKFVDSVFAFGDFIPQLAKYVAIFATQVVELVGAMVRAVSNGLSDIDRQLAKLPGEIGVGAAGRLASREAAATFSVLSSSEAGAVGTPGPRPLQNTFNTRLADALGIVSAADLEAKRSTAGVAASQESVDRNERFKAQLRDTARREAREIITGVVLQINREASRRALSPDGTTVDRATAVSQSNLLRGLIDPTILAQVRELAPDLASGLAPFTAIDLFQTLLPDLPQFGALTRSTGGAASRPTGGAGAFRSNFVDRFKLRREARSDVGSPLDNLRAALIGSGGDFVSQGALTQEEVYRGLLTSFERAALQFDETRSRADTIRNRGTASFESTLASLTDPADAAEALKAFGGFLADVSEAETGQTLKTMSEAFKSLTEIDPTDASAVNRAFAELGTRYREIGSLVGEKGARQFGVGGAIGLGGAAFSRFGVPLADRSVRDLTLFGSTPQLQLRAAEQRLDFLRREDGLYGDLLDKYRDALKTTIEREAFEAEIARQIAKQTEEFERQRAKLQFEIAKDKNPLVKGLDRLGLFKLDDETGRPRIKTAAEQFEEIGTELGASFVTGFSSATGDTIFNVVTGRFDDIRQVWQNMIEGMLKIFTDFLGKLITSQLVDAFFGNSLASALGGGGGVGSGLSPIGGVGSVPSDYLGASAIGGVYAIGGIASRPQYALIGEGGSSEMVAPLNRRGRLPLSMTARGPAAVLPGGRLVPAEFSGGNPTPNLTAGQRPVVNVVVLTDPREITARGLVANGAILANVAAANIRNRGAIASALTR